MFCVTDFKTNVRSLNLEGDSNHALIFCHLKTTPSEMGPCQFLACQVEFWYFWRVLCRMIFLGTSSWYRYRWRRQSMTETRPRTSLEYRNHELLWCACFAQLRKTTLFGRDQPWAADAPHVLICSFCPVYPSKRNIVNGWVAIPRKFFLRVPLREALTLAICWCTVNSCLIISYCLTCAWFTPPHT